MLPHLEAIREFRSPYAPGLTVLAARLSEEMVGHMARPVYVSGKGRQYKNAQHRLFGEAAERASIFGPKANDCWTATDPLSGSDRIISPMDAYGSDWRPTSHGCAAHNYREVAELASMAELWERRLVADWWQGHADLHHISARALEVSGILDCASALRRGAMSARDTEFFLIGSADVLFVAAAVSHDGSFEQMAIGFAAAADPYSALSRSFLEVLTVELETADLVRARLDNEPLISGSDRDRVARLQSALRAPVLAALSDGPGVEPAKFGTPKCAGSHDIATAAAAQGQRMLLVDMTLDSIGIPTCRAIFEDPSLMPFTKDQGELRPL